MRFWNNLHQAQNLKIGKSNNQKIRNSGDIFDKKPWFYMKYIRHNRKWQTIMSLYCCFFANHAALRHKNKDWVGRSQVTHLLLWYILSRDDHAYVPFVVVTIPSFFPLSCLFIFAFSVYFLWDIVLVGILLVFLNLF